MTFVTDSPIIGEELLDDVGDVGRRENVTYKDALRGGVNEVNTGVVTGYVNVTERIGDKAASEGGEMSQSDGKAVFEERDQGRGGERRAREEASFLNVMAREHRKVRDGEFKVSHLGRLRRKNSGLRDDCY